MKKAFAMIGLTALLAVGCTSTSYQGASDDARYSTPSWGTSSTESGYTAPGATQSTQPAPRMDGERDFEDMTPAAGHNHGHEPQMPPTESDVKNGVPDFGTQHK